MCVAGRFYVKLRIRNQGLGYDDAFIIFGTCSMISSVGLLFAFIDTSYMVEGLVFGTRDPDFAVPADSPEKYIEQSGKVVASLVLSWVTIACVKFSFLALFRGMVDRIPPMLLYWKVVVLFNVLVCIYTVVGFVYMCPHYGNLKTGKSRPFMRDFEVGR